MPPALFAGAAARVITPDPADGPVYLAGFQANRPATAVHDDLYARALALRMAGREQDPSGPACFVMVVCDLIGVLHRDVLAIRQEAQHRGLDPRGLVVSSTHTHSGPDTIGLWGPSRLRSGVAPRYLAFVRQQVVDAALDAVANLEPAHLRVGATQSERWLRNGRQPEIVDRELSVLQAQTPQGEPIFTLVNLACHPEVMFGQNTAITADYAGALCREVERQAGGLALFASADIGGMMTPDVADHGRSFETVEAMGSDLATMALAALEAGQDLRPSACHFARRDVHIPLRNPLFKFAMRIGVLPSLQERKSSDVSTQVSLLDLGAARLVTIPGELLPGPGMDLRHMLGVPYRFLIGLADDELGYLLPSGEYRYPRNPFRPGDHYEETMSLSKYATPLLVEAWAALLRQAAHR
jgi:hypothetical protein